MFLYYFSCVPPSHTLLFRQGPTAYTTSSHPCHGHGTTNPPSFFYTQCSSISHSLSFSCVPLHLDTTSSLSTNFHMYTSSPGVHRKAPRFFITISPTSSSHMEPLQKARFERKICRSALVVALQPPFPSDLRNGLTVRSWRL